MSVVHFDLEVVVDEHAVELESFTKDVVLLQEIASLTQNSLDKLLSLLHKLLMLLVEGKRLGLVPNQLEWLLVILQLGNELEDLLCIAKSTVETLSPVDHEQGVVPVNSLVVLEEHRVVDVGHLSRQFSDCELAMAEEIYKGMLLLPDFRVLLENGLQVADFVV